MYFILPYSPAMSTLPSHTLTLDDLAPSSPIRQAIDAHFDLIASRRAPLAEWIDDIDGARLHGSGTAMMIELPSPSMSDPVYLRLKAVARQASARYRRKRRAKDALIAALNDLLEHGTPVPGVLVNA